ncbi:MAG: toll/interleukin-1 receptor domain-containing protein [Planctomycetes bacterium]|nr:toll/interleukin-1 receptor domain-containing protein [Planctomycetota bacterium]
MLYDLFICHASEDKETFVRPLANALRADHVEVWLDEFTLELGDSIRRSIDNGLRQSWFGIIVLSPAFFNKKWPQYELDGLTEIEMRGNDKVLLPIWHNVSHNDVFAYSPPLANRLAISSAEGLDKVVAAIIRVVRPQGSPLVEARNLLLQWNIAPPVITDPYWLEVVEASNRVDAFGAAVPEESVWGRWTFPLPSKEGGPQQWGERLAWTAMQLHWSEEAEKRAITPLTPPEEVLRFIDEQPGLFEICEMFPDLLIEYAPQLTITGFAGDFEVLFERLYDRSIAQHEETRKNGSTSGTGLTINGQVTMCTEEWALRHPTFGNYDSTTVADMYFSGGMFGPPVSPYEHIDHLVWLLSEASAWLPDLVHQVLIDGMADWGVWLWTPGDWERESGIVEAMLDTDKGRPFRWSPKRKGIAVSRFQKTIDTLRLPETAEELLARFIRSDFIGKWISKRRERSSRKDKT